MKQRLDILLVDLQLVSSRQQAQRLIQAGEVMVNDQIIDKSGTEVKINSTIRIKQRSLYVSRGGEKLAKALQLFSINVNNRICLDAGISTGGFTDCLLQNGAKQVYGIDVGYGQVDWKLRNDPRVILHERTNFRYVTFENLYHNNLDIPNFAVADLSFISLTKILSNLWDLLSFPKELILLVKPQFEVGKENVGKKGVVRDSTLQAKAIAGVLQLGLELGWKYQGLTWSPMTGPAGNIEYLLWLGMDSREHPPDLSVIESMTKSAAESFKL